MKIIRKTKQGPVRGEEGLLQHFWGIPYGKAERFEKPGKPDERGDVLDCTKKEQVALQNSRREGVIGTEDCLNLDICTRKEAQARPVLVYLHGGNNQTGSSFELEGDELVLGQDIVFVSLNHRLGLFGMNCLPCLTMHGESGNFALLDIACALTWIKENIENFGGDPKRITVSGFSAGGRNVMAMLYSPLFTGLFQRAIVFSGGQTMSDVDRSASQIAWFLSDLAMEDGKAENKEEAVQWLLEENMDVKNWLVGLEGKRLAGLIPGAGIRMAKFPHLYRDGIVLPKEGFAGPCVNSVPVLLLTGTTEFSMFCAFDPLLKEDPESLNFAVRYGSALYRNFNTQWSAENMDCRKVVVQIEYGGADSGTKIPVLGSFHGIFMGMLKQGGPVDMSGPGYQAMKARFLPYLRGFLESGDVNLLNPDVVWPEWEKGNRSTLCLDGVEEEGTAVVTVKDCYESSQEILDALAEDHSISEEKKRFVLEHILNGRWFSAELDKRFGTPSYWH